MSTPPSHPAVSPTTTPAGVPPSARSRPMFSWIRNARTTHTRPAALGLEPLEMREVPAGLALGLANAPGPNEHAILASNAVAAHEGKDNHGAQVTGGQF